MAPTPALAFVALGSNLGERETRLAEALAALAALPRTALRAVSGVYETDPVGPPPQGPYLNMAAALETGLAPRALLEALLATEARAGRRRSGRRDAPRTLDLDLLLYGERVVDEPGLTLPHPRMHLRAFVLEPLNEIAPDARHPVLGSRIEDLARDRRDPSAVRRLGPLPEAAPTHP